MPWDEVLRRASNPSHEHWDREIKNKIAVLKRQVTPSVPITSDESAQPAFANRPLPWIQLQRQQRQKQQQPQQQQQNPPKKQKLQHKYCGAFNTSAGCAAGESECPEGLKHTCSYCERPGHAAAVCYRKFPSLNQGKGKGKKTGRDTKNRQ